jgi:hypothetical protein
MAERVTMKRHYLSVVVWVAWVSLLSTQAAKATINPRPRVLLDQSLVSTLQSRVVANSSTWQNFRTQEDALYGRVPSGSTELLYAPDYALLYAVLNGMPANYQSPHTAANYGAYALTLAEAAVDLANAACNGGNPCTVDNPPWHGNDYRNAGPLMAMVYDWCYPLMTSAQKTKFYTALDLSSRFFLTDTNPNVQNTARADAFNLGQGPGGNLYAGYWSASLLIGYATFGDNPTDDTVNQTNFQISSALTEFQTNVVPFYNTGFGVGGMLAEGAEYSPEVWFYIGRFLLAAESAENRDLWASVPNWPIDAANAIFNYTSPTTANRWYSTLYTYEPLEYGDIQLDARYQLAEGTRIAMLEIAYHLGNSTEGNYARWYLNNIQPSFNPSRKNQDYALWDFMFLDPIGEQTDYRSSLSPDYYSAGNEFVFGRSDWSPNATWTTFNSGPALTNHQHMQAGNFTIYRKGQWLVLDPPGYSVGWSSFDVHSIFGYKGTLDTVWKGPAVAKCEGVASIPRYEDGPNAAYIYARGNTGPNYRVDAGYSTREGDWLNPQTVSRDWVYLKPDYWVVFDRGVCRDPTDVRFQLVTPASQTYGGGIVTSTNAGQSVFLTPVFPTNPIVTITNLADTDVDCGGTPCNALGQLSHFRAEVQVGQQANQQTMLNVIQAGDQGITPYPVQPIQSGNLMAAQIKSPTGDMVVGFSASAAGADLPLPVSYTFVPSAPTSQHLITGLTPNVPVHVSLVASGSGVAVSISNAASAPGQAAITSSAGTLFFTYPSTSTTGSSTSACDLNHDGVVNVLDVQISINQVIGTAPCTNADLIGSGVCTVVDVQRVINAVNTGVCKVGP